MTAVRTFSRNALIYLSSNVLNAALPFLLLPFLVRELGAEEYGRIGLVAAAFSLLLPVVGLGTRGFVRSSYNQVDRDELRLIVGNATLLTALACAVLTALLVLGGAALDLPLAWPYLVVGGLAAFGQGLINIRLVLWQMAGRPARYGLLSILLTFLNLLLSLALVFLLQLQAEGRILGMWLPLVFAAPLLLVIMARAGDLSLAFSGRVARDILRFGLPLIPHAIALLLVVFVERAVLSQSPDPAALGVYFAAFQLALPLTILANSINLQFRAWSDPLMAAGEHHRVVQASYAIMLLLIAAAALYAWLLGFVYTLVVGEAMAHGYSACIVLVFAAMFRGCYLVVVKGVLFTRRTRPLMALTVTLALLFSALLLLVQDMMTVAWLNLAFNATLFACVWLLSARMLPQPWLSPLGRR